MDLVGPVSVDYLHNKDQRFLILGDVHFSRKGAPSGDHLLTVPQLVDQISGSKVNWSKVNWYLEAPEINNDDYLQLIKEHFPEQYEYFVKNCQQDFLSECREAVGTNKQVSYRPFDLRNDPTLMDSQILTKIKFVHFSSVIFRLYNNHNGCDRTSLGSDPIEASKLEIQNYFEKQHSIPHNNPFLGYHAPKNRNLLLNFYYYVFGRPTYFKLITQIKPPTMAQRLKLGTIFSRTENEIVKLPFSIKNLVYTLTRICDIYTFLLMLLDNQSAANQINVYYGGTVHSDRIISMLTEFYSLQHQVAPRLDIRHHRLEQCTLKTITKHS